jgi:hypothetical protein
MKEFMLLIRNREDSKSNFSPEKNLQFLEACRVYVERLLKNGSLKSAQPLIREGKMLSGSKDGWSETPYSESTEVIVGYYHVFANNIDEAIAIAKDNPEFQYTTTARIEVRPIKTKEESTAYVYPKGD